MEARARCPAEADRRRERQPAVRRQVTLDRGSTLESGRLDHDLHADDRLDPRLERGPVEADRAVETLMVGEPEGVHAVARGTLQEHTR